MAEESVTEAYSLQAGENHLSVPLVPGDPDPGSVFGSVTSIVAQNMAYSFSETAKRQEYRQSTAAQSSLTAITPERGYTIQAPSSRSGVITGRKPYLTSIMLPPGESLVAWPSRVSAPVLEALARWNGWENDIESISSIHDGTNLVFAPANQGAATLTEFTPGNAYTIRRNAKAQENIVWPIKNPEAENLTPSRTVHAYAHLSEELANLSLEINWGDGEGFTTFAGTGTHTYAKDGNYTVQVRAGDVLTSNTIAVDLGAPHSSGVSGFISGMNVTLADLGDSIFGSAADLGGSGLEADSISFSLHRLTDNLYWNGSAWQAMLVWLGTEHKATSGLQSVVWSSASPLPIWQSGAYAFRVRVVDRAGNVSITEEIIFYCEMPPDPPGNLEAVADADNLSIELTWDAAARAESYEIWRSESNDSSTAVSLAKIEGTSYEDETIAPNVVYHYWVKAANISGNSDYSGSASATVPLSAALTFDTGAALNDGILYGILTLERRIQRDLVLTLISSAQEGLTLPDVEYIFAGDDSVTFTVRVELDQLPTPPTYVTVLCEGHELVTAAIPDLDDNGIADAPPELFPSTCIVPSGFTASWTPVAGATGYRLDIATDDSFSTVLKGYDGLLVNDVSLVVAGLSPAVQYYYRVRAVNNTGQGAFSETATVLTANSSWETVSLDMDTSLNAVWGSAATDILAVGENGLVLHRQNGVWAQEADGLTSSSLTSLWGTSTGEILIWASAMAHQMDCSWQKNPGIPQRLRRQVCLPL